MVGEIVSARCSGWVPDSRRRIGREAQTGVLPPVQVLRMYIDRGVILRSSMLKVSRVRPVFRVDVLPSGAPSWRRELDA